MTKLRIIAVLMIAVLAIALVGCTGSDEATEEAAFQTGETVAAEWTDGKLYMAEVTAVGDDGMVTVRYLDDDGEGVLEEAQVFSIEEKEWAEGDRVLAVWAVARFYSGTVESMEEDGDYIITWDDGSDPSSVMPEQIIEYNAKYADDAE